MHIYLAGPYTLPEGSEEENARRAILVAEELRAAGHYVLCPHAMYPSWERVPPLSWEEVMSQCLAWVTRCDALVRLPGESRGADMEEDLARSAGMTVYAWEGLPLQLEREARDGAR